jgi:hypothetical protein
MLRKLQIQENATQKILEIDPDSTGVMLFLRNLALNERIHIELDIDDMRAIVALLQARIEDIRIGNATLEKLKNPFTHSVSYTGKITSFQIDPGFFKGTAKED